MGKEYATPVYTPGDSSDELTATGKAKQSAIYAKKGIVKTVHKKIKAGETDLNTLEDR
jgi:hypothetical protein